LAHEMGHWVGMGGHAKWVPEGHERLMGRGLANWDVVSPPLHYLATDRIMENEKKMFEGRWRFPSTKFVDGYQDGFKDESKPFKYEPLGAW